MALRIVETAEELVRLEPAWNRLGLAQPRPNPMLSWEWAATWWNVYGASEPTWKLSILVEEHEGVVEAVGPLYRTPNGRGSNFQWLGTGDPESDAVCGDYLGLLALPHDSGQVTRIDEALLDLLETGDDRLILSDMTVGDPTCEALAGRLASAHCAVRRLEGPVCPYLSLPASAEEWLASLSSNFRSQIRQSQRAWKERPQARWVRNAEDLDRFWPELVRLHQARSAALGRPGVFSGPKFSAFHKEVAARFLKKGWLLAGWMEQDGTAVAANYAFRLGATVYFYQSGLDPALAPRMRAGILMHVETIREAMARGDREYDFLRGGDEYKKRFTDGSRSLFTLDVERRSLRSTLRWWKEEGVEALRTAQRTLATTGLPRFGRSR